ncbi:hypothetical protein [Malikia sp.]|uniref:hypothetical protein n=1 Tax=Malikia sp. TaxID=2070706 RepID=UPI002621A719|nr:hypothetical protein [Malikia sp.]MDD2730391.1 hypothetical protein [Malikia sp.]
MNLNLVHHNLTMAAEAARQKTERCEALAVVVKAMIDPASAGPMPIVELAKALRAFDLCIVHREIVQQAADVVRETDDHEGLSLDELDHLLTQLERSIHAGANT